MKNLENGIAKFDQKVFESLLMKMVYSYKYFNNNEAPIEVVVPFVAEVDGVKVRYIQPRVKRKRKMSHASAS